MKILVPCLFLLLVLFSCHQGDDDATTIEEKVECLNNLFTNYRILTPEDTNEECIWNNVYLYKGEIYYTTVCCVCDLLPAVYDCNGVEVCELDMACIDDFYANAYFIYSIQEIE